MRGTSLPYTSDFTQIVSRGGMPLDGETVGLQGRKSKRNDEMNDGMRRWKGQRDRPGRFTVRCKVNTKAEEVRRDDQGPCGLVG